MIEILYIVFWVIGLVFFWPVVTVHWPYAPHLYYMLMLALAGLALFDGRGIMLR